MSLTDALAMVEGAAPIDARELEERAAELATTSIEPERDVTEQAIRCTDLTSLNEDDTAEKITQLCAAAVVPDPEDASVPSVAAVCIHPQFVPTAARSLKGTGVKVAAVAGGFPSGNDPTDAKLEEIRRVLEAGADEVDMTMNRPAFLAGEYRQTFEEVAAAKEVCGDAPLKVILETGALGSYDAIRMATVVVMAGGADFVKTSTGKAAPGASPPAALCIMEAIRKHRDHLGRRVGIKVSGGVRKAEAARGYLRLVHRILGPEWLHPDLFRIGASSLLDDLMKDLRAERAADPPGPG